MHAAKTVCTHNSSVCAEPDMQCLAVHRAALVGMAHSGVTPPPLRAYLALHSNPAHDGAVVVFLPSLAAARSSAGMWCCL